MRYLKNKVNGSDEIKTSYFMYIIIALIASVFWVFFVEKYRFITVAISIVLVIMLLSIKETSLDNRFPYIESNGNSKLDRFINAVITLIYVIINNTAIIFALLGAYVISLYVLVGSDNIIDSPNLNGSYVIQEYVENEENHVILFDNKFKYEVKLLGGENYSIGEKQRLNLKDKELYEIVKVEKNN